MPEKNVLDGKKILIVDDEPDILESLQELLSMCETVTAGSYADAARLIENEPFDLAILDIMGVAGYDLLALCVEKNVTAVMLTAKALARADVVRSYKEGAAYFIPKEEMFRMDTFLADVLEAQARGKNTWAGWYDRLTSYAERTFERSFDPNAEDFLQQLIKY